MVVRATSLVEVSAQEHVVNIRHKKYVAWIFWSFIH